MTDASFSLIWVWALRERQLLQHSVRAGSAQGPDYAEGDVDGLTSIRPVIYFSHRVAKKYVATPAGLDWYSTIKESFGDQAPDMNGSLILYASFELATNNYTGTHSCIHVL